MTSPFVAALRSVALNVPDPDLAAGFYTEVWNLAVADRRDGAVYLRGTGPAHHLLALHPGEQAEIRNVTFRARSADALAVLAERTVGAGGRVLQPVAPVAEPGGGVALTIADQDGRISMPPNLLGREGAMRLLRAAGGRRVAVYSIENEDGTPIYVHAKICVIDDTWASVGSDNANRRSWTHDSELGCTVVDDGADASHSWPRSLRHELSLEHLGAGADVTELDDPVLAFDAFRRAAAALDDWHRGGRRGPRPPGQLRRYTQPALSPWTRAWATPLYRVLFDPDGRSPLKRWARHF